MFKPHYAIKGVDGQGRPIWTRSEMSIKEKMAGVVRTKLKFWVVEVE